jgi:hypothetical protein
MEMLSENERRIPVEELNTSSALAHARAQAAARKLDDGPRRDRPWRGRPR